MNSQTRKRVTGASLSQYLGQYVTVFGEFMQLESSGRTFTMKTASNDIVTVQLQEPVQDLLQGFIEVQGTVSHNNTIKCQHLISFPKEFYEKADMSLHNEVLSLASRFPDHYVTLP
ncbi:replication protein A 14 kDa subunit [Parasteatoda tepidariorum]|uniref:replication protein A 14 kDa subunit n=1 Tax=Parasteatoda tepidariorum TaxID=114398 RepID=UPI00077FC3FC